MSYQCLGPSSEVTKKGLRMGTSVFSRLTARLVVFTLALAFFAVALSTSAPNASASSALSWTTEMPMGADIAQAVVVGAANGTVYVMGGVFTIAYSEVATAYAYDPDTGGWRVLAPMLYAARGAAGAMGLDGKVYVFGGASGSSYTQIYDPVANSWSLGAAMLDGAWEAKAATVTNGTIWVVGGEGVSAGYAQLYDSAANTWSVGKPAPVAVECGAMVSVGDDLYYSGGGVADYTATTNFYMYDASAGNWVTTLQTMPIARAAQAMAVGVDGLIYVIGGATDAFNSGDAFSSVSVYDPATDAWSAAASMDNARKYLGATVTPDGRIMSLGGNDASSVFDVVESLQLYLFSYTIDLSATSARAGEPVLLKLDAQFTYIDEISSELTYYLVSDADGTIYSPASVEIPTDAPAAITVNVPELAPPGDYRVVVFSWVVFGVNAVELVENVELPLVVTPSPAAVDALIADLEAQLADLQAALASDDANVTAISMQVAIMQAKLDGIISGMAAAGAQQTAAMAALNATLADLQSQLDDFQEQINRVEDKADTAGTYGMVTLVLVIIVIVLIALMVMMSRKKP